MNEDASRAALQRMQRYHIIKHSEDGYAVEIALLARWVRERALMDHS